jgi:hydrogenase maturation protein HypF
VIRIIGIGSPFGDDAVGLEVARILAEAPPRNCEIIAANRPSAALVELLDGAEAAILVDAVHSGLPAGTLHDLGFDELGRDTPHFVSSHDLDVAAAVQLARTLGRAPSRGRLIGLEISPARTNPMYELSSISREAMSRLVARVRSYAAEFDDRERKRLMVKGTVQGVGMRPFVWRLAHAIGLAGLARNVAGGIEIEIEGSSEQTAEFQRRLLNELPRAAKVESIEVAILPTSDEREFRAMASERGRTATTIPPDLAICTDCAREIIDPADRRYRYPFTNCTSCGPRFTVVRALPYDRATTTLDGFRLCEECRHEYLDPSNRRFRAEPIACPKCGPQAWLETSESDSCAGRPEDDCIARAAAIVRGGGVIAVQGVGGVHLACDVSNETEVKRLREIKRRQHKPLAMMVDSIEAARQLAIISEDEAALLSDPSAPIVLLRKLPGAPLPPAVAPGNDYVGIMIAYSPLHILLMRECGCPLIMTSANRPEEPLARDGGEARTLFAAQVDALLLHNRPIHQRCDDSVWMVGPAGRQPIRLGRGNTPGSITAPVAAPSPILAVGGDIKNSFCVLSGRSALMSQYIGALENTATQEHFRDSLERWLAMSAIKLAVAVHDLHPQCFARATIAPLGLETITVQHHHAHIASCLAEHGQCGPAIGIAFDGTGYGPDGCIWGGEAMMADLHEFTRLSHLQTLPLAGGDAAVHHPSRVAASFLIGLFGSMFNDRVRKLVGEESAHILARMIERGINTFQTSSCGRLFDAVAALLGVSAEATYEAQAAIELETIARTSPPSNRVYPFSIGEGVVAIQEMLAAIVTDLEHGTPIARIARAFHDTMAEIVAVMAADARAKTGIELVALSGGCFQNRLLLAGSIKKLERSGFTVLVHRRVPANDGGLALGQAVVAAARLNS